jgi:hypothetical protein
MIPPTATKPEVDEQTGLERDSTWDDAEWEYQRKKALEQQEAAERAASDDEDAPTGPEDIIVAGVQMSFPDMGGKRPTSATLVFTGGKVELQGGTAFKKGMAISFSGVAIVNHVAQKDTHDPQTGQVVSAEQQHKARIIDLKVHAGD